MNSLLIVGAGGLAKQLLPQIVHLKYDRTAWYDSGNVDVRLESYFPVIPNEIQLREWLNTNGNLQKFDFLLAVGKPNLRKYFFNLLIKLTGNCIGLNHHCTEKTPFIKISPSASLLSEVYLESFTEIGIGTLINVRAQIHHDTKIGDFCEIGPGAVLLGNVTIGDESFIGAQATILPGVTLGSNVIVGAGSVVTQNFPDGAKIAGNPAKPIL